MKNMHCAFSAISLSLWLLGGAGLALAQGTNLGTIRGNVTDPNGSIIANAKVQVTDLETNLSRDFTTDKEGNYEAVGLKSGNYRVSVTATGLALLWLAALLTLWTGYDYLKAALLHAMER